MGRGAAGPEWLVERRSGRGPGGTAPRPPPVFFFFGRRGHDARDYGDAKRSRGGDGRYYRR